MQNKFNSRAKTACGEVQLLLELSINSRSENECNQSKESISLDVQLYDSISSLSSIVNVQLKNLLSV